MACGRPTLFDSAFCDFHDPRQEFEEPINEATPAANTQVCPECSGTRDESFGRTPQGELCRNTFHGTGTTPLPEGTELSQVVRRTLSNYASCRSSIRGDGDNGEFYASLMLCFGDPDRSKSPIEDLVDQATAAILSATKRDGDRRVLEARLEESAKYATFTRPDNDLVLTHEWVLKRMAHLAARLNYPPECSHPEHDVFNYCPYEPLERWRRDGELELNRQLNERPKQ